MSRVKFKSKPLSMDLLGEEWFQEWLSHPMRREQRRVNAKSKQAESNAKLLREFRLLPNGNTKRKLALRGMFNEMGLPYGFVNDTVLKACYEKVTLELDFRYGLTEAYRTRFEDGFSRVFKGISKHKIIPGAWIGPYCADLFCPTLRVPIFINGKWTQMVGVDFEIDGQWHDKEEKGAKDNKRDNLILDNKIYIKRIQNKNITSSLIKSEIIEIKRFGSTDNSSVRNQERKIWILTLAYFLSKPFEIQDEKILTKDILNFLTR